jgi:hypothetical protein
MCIHPGVDADAEGAGAAGFCVVTVVLLVDVVTVSVEVADSFESTVSALCAYTKGTARKSNNKIPTIRSFMKDTSWLLRHEGVFFVGEEPRTCVARSGFQQSKPIDPSVSAPSIPRSNRSAVAITSTAAPLALAARLMSPIATDDVMFYMLLLMGAVLLGLLEIAPQRADDTAHLTDLEHLRMLNNLLMALWTARLPVAEKLSNALAQWMNRDADILSVVLPEPRAIGNLDSLLLLVRIARGVREETTLARWRPAFADALRRIVTDGAVFVNHSRPSFPSPFWLRK